VVSHACLSACIHPSSLIADTASLQFRVAPGCLPTTHTQITIRARITAYLSFSLSREELDFFNADPAGSRTNDVKKTAKSFLTPSSNIISELNSNLLPPFLCRYF